MKRITIILLIGLFLATSCNKDDGIDNPHGLPSATETGANTFGCLLNGEPWVAEIGTEVLSPSAHKLLMNYDETNVGLDNGNDWILRSKQLSDSINESFVVKGDNLIVPIDLDLESNNLAVTFRSNKTNPFTEYRLNSLEPYSVEITKLDTTENICSGRFSCTLVSTIDSFDIIEITEGRFDKKYDQY